MVGDMNTVNTGGKEQALVDQLRERAKELETEIKEWKSGALQRGWREQWEERNPPEPPE